jgi:hypothetical protein
MSASERVSIIQGKLPILVVAPHGFDGDDIRTALIAEYIANTFGYYAVINHGWERDDDVDFMRDKADCNNVNHCHEDVVKEEFLEPIIRFKNRIHQKFPIMHAFFIHGMSNKHKQISGDPNMDMVIGHGAGAPNSFSCDSWRKDYFIHLLDEVGIHAYCGSKGGLMSGWARSNMNQLFRKWYPDPTVQSMQVEIMYELREENEIALITAEYLGTVMKDMIDAKSFATTKIIPTY